jgi:hypothetical protein
LTRGSAGTERSHPWGDKGYAGLDREGAIEAGHAPTPAVSADRGLALTSSPMRTQPLAIPGLAGPIVLESSFWTSQFTVTVGGHEAPRTGRRRFALPAAGGGAVEGTLRGTFLDVYPTVEIAGTRYPTGPAVPVILRILVALPFVLVFLGGLVGGLIGAAGVLGNMAVVRLPGLSTAVKVIVTLVILLATSIVWLVVATVLASALR